MYTDCCLFLLEGQRLEGSAVQRHRRVKDHMQRDIPVVTPQTLLADAALLMINSRSRQVVVVLEDGGKRRPVAMLTDGDLAYHMVKSN